MFDLIRGIYVVSSRTSPADCQHYTFFSNTIEMAFTHNLLGTRREGAVMPVCGLTTTKTRLYLSEGVEDFTRTACAEKAGPGNTLP